MARSKSKLIYLHRSQFKKFLFNPKKRNIRTQKYYNLLQDPKISIRPFFLLWKRNANINNYYINNKIAIYNGKIFIINNLKLDVKGYKFGELANTKKRIKHTGKQRQIKKIIKKLNDIKKNKFINIKFVKKRLNKKKK